MRGRFKQILDTGGPDADRGRRDGADPREHRDGTRDLTCYDETREAFGLLKLWLDEVDEGDTQLADDALRAVLARVGGEGLAQQFRLLAGVMFLWEENESGRSRAEVLARWRARLDV